VGEFVEVGGGHPRRDGVAHRRERAGHDEARAAHQGDLVERLELDPLGQGPHGYAPAKGWRAEIARSVTSSTVPSALIDTS
jgi:hypothetical protein